MDLVGRPIFQIKLLQCKHLLSIRTVNKIFENQYADQFNGMKS